MTCRWLLALLAACGPRPDPNHVTTSCLPFGASDDRSALAYLDGDRLVVQAGGTTHSIHLTACMTEHVDQLFVAPNGVAVAASGTASNMPFDLWGHSGEHSTTSCMITVANEIDGKFTASKLVVWADGEPTALTQEQLPGSECSVSSTAAGPVATCIAGSSVVVRRYHGRELAQLGEDATWPLADVGGITGTRLSPTGRYLAYWGTSLRLIDLSNGTEALAFADLGRVGAVEIDPAGGTDVLIVGVPYDNSDKPTVRVRRVGRAGITFTRDEVGADRIIYWTEPGAYWATHYCGAERVVMH